MRFYKYFLALCMLSSVISLPTSAKEKTIIHDGLYQIVSTEKSNQVINKEGNLETTSNSDATKWEVKTDKKGKVTFTNVQSGKTLKVSGNKKWNVSESKEGMHIYSSGNYLTEKDNQTKTDTKKQSSTWKLVPASSWQGTPLSAMSGTVVGPNGKETYYNLDMSTIVDVLHQRGYQGQYWEREDGAKMFGEYILVAANYEIHPYGSLVETSMGMGIVADTGGFAAANPEQLDIATNW